LVACLTLVAQLETQAQVGYRHEGGYLRVCGVEANRRHNFFLPGVGVATGIGLAERSVGAADEVGFHDSLLLLSFVVARHRASHG
jgi:hypothetical protein